VTTILPDAKINAVVLGSRIRMTTAANRYEGQRLLKSHITDDSWGEEGMAWRIREPIGEIVNRSVLRLGRDAQERGLWIGVGSRDMRWN
jgi:hypothetical protein